MKPVDGMSASIVKVFEVLGDFQCKIETLFRCMDYELRLSLWLACILGQTLADLGPGMGEDDRVGERLLQGGILDVALYVFITKRYPVL